MELLPFVILLCLFSGSHGEQYVGYIIRLVVNRSQLLQWRFVNLLYGFTYPTPSLKQEQAQTDNSLICSTFCKCVHHVFDSSLSLPLTSYLAQRKNVFFSHITQNWIFDDMFGEIISICIFLRFFQSKHKNQSQAH